MSDSVVTVHFVSLERFSYIFLKGNPYYNFPMCYHLIHRFCVLS